MEYPVPVPNKTHHVFDGAPIYEARFEDVSEFRFPGIAAVRDASGAYHIDFFGNPIYAERYEAVGDFSDSTAWVKDAEGFHYIDEAGCRINAETYTAASDFRDRVAVIYHEICGATHITTAGEMLYNDWYFDALPFAGDEALVRDEEGWLVINRGGEVLRRIYAKDIAARGTVRISPRKNRIAELLAAQTYDAAVLLLRHAERQPFFRGVPGNDILLTVRGEKAAAALGTQFPKINAAYASPMPRCMRTAALISGIEPESDTMLGDPGAYVSDNPKSREYYQHASTVTSIRAYIKGSDLPGHYSIEEGTKRLLAHLKKLGEKDGVTLCVTHDAFAAAFTAKLTGYDFADDWVDFMDGCILLRSGETWRLVWREGETAIA